MNIEEQLVDKKETQQIHLNGAYLSMQEFVGVKNEHKSCVFLCAAILHEITQQASTQDSLVDAILLLNKVGVSSVNDLIYMLDGVLMKELALRLSPPQETN